MRIRRILALPLFIFTFFISTFSAYADMANIINNVTSNNNTSGNTTSVNNVQTNTNSNGTTSTDIKINDNGKVTQYHSDQPGSVNINSENGNTHIQINNNERNVTITTSSSATPDMKKIEEKSKKAIKSTLKLDRKTSSASADFKIFNFDIRQFFYNLFNFKWF